MGNRTSLKFGKLPHDASDAFLFFIDEAQRGNFRVFAVVLQTPENDVAVVVNPMFEPAERKYLGAELCRTTLDFVETMAARHSGLEGP